MRIDERKRIKATLGNPRWRLNHLYSIVSKDGQKIPFRENLPQRALNDRTENRLLILKPRQVGISTNCILVDFDHTIFNRNVTTCILAHKKSAVEKLFRICHRAYNFLPEGFRPRLDRGGGSKYEMFFPEINSRIYCDLEVRGDTLQRLHISEGAFISDQDRLKATLQAAPPQANVRIESTPNGFGNYFYESWHEPHARFGTFFFPWFLFPEYTLPTPQFKLTQEEEALQHYVTTRYKITLTLGQFAYRRFRKAELKNLFIQEYPEDEESCFLASGSASMDLVLIKKLFDQAPDPIEEVDGVLIYEPYERGEHYVIGADCAEGVGGDSSAASVIRVSNRKQVATLRGQWKPFDFAHKLNFLASLYTTGGRHWPLLGVERNNHGHAVLLELHENINYPNLFHRPQDERPGWLTDRISRPLILDQFIEAVEHGILKLQDRQTLKECLTLVNENGKIQHASGHHDDTIFGAAIANHLALEFRSLNLYENIKGRILLG